MTKNKKPDLAKAIIANQARKSWILKQWGLTEKPNEVTQVELDYWLIFVVDQFSPLLSRRNCYIQDWGVRGKIAKLKTEGKWPVAPERNKQFLDMFKIAYHFPP